MSAVVIVLIALMLVDAKIAPVGSFWEDYSRPVRSNALKGIFVMAVFISHIRGYITIGDEDALAVSLSFFLGQLMVTPFLFFSGFGVMESIRKKGTDYVRRIPVHRAIKTWIHFAASVVLFWVLNWVLHIPMTLRDMLLSLVGWVSVGNSAWYVFTVFFLYLITAVSFLIFRKNELAGLICTTVLTFAYIFLMIPLRISMWYNTALCYVFGMWYSFLRPWVEKVVMRSDACFCGCLLAAFYIFRKLMEFRTYSSWIYQLYAIFFMVLLIGISMKFRLDNPFLQFLGRHTFSIYILQRIPMRFLEARGIFIDDHVTMFILSFLTTCLLAIVFDCFLSWLDSRIFDRKVSV